MACILKPECNFLHGYFRCLLPLETVDIEVKVKMMRGIHMFRRDRTTQVISCNPWSTRLCPYPSLIRKMKMYLELEGKLGPNPNCNHAPALLPMTETPQQKKKPWCPRKWRRKREPKHQWREGSKMWEHLGQFPLLKHPQLLKHNRQKRGSHPSYLPSPMLWY